MKDFSQIARDLVPLFHVARTGKPRAVKGCFDKARAYFKANGLTFNPMGCGNKKTGLPGWYRPTGCSESGSCPSRHKLVAHEQIIVSYWRVTSNKR